MSPEKFNTIYEKYYDLLYRVCFLYMKNTPDSLDIVQDVFLKVLNGKADDVNEEKLKSWLIVTASNLCKSQLRSWWNKKRSEYDDGFTHQFENNVTKVQSEVLEEVLSLEWKYRVPVYLHYYEGYTTTEIGHMLKTSPSTIQTRLSKARKILRLNLDGNNVNSNKSAKSNNTHKPSIPASSGNRQFRYNKTRPAASSPDNRKEGSL